MTFNLECEMTDRVNSFLKRQGYLTTVETRCGGWGICDLIGVRFGDRVKRSKPKCESLIAVELKLEDVAGVMSQCKNNKAVVNYAFAAMPRSRVNRMSPATLRSFNAEGVGLIAVEEDSDECSICIMPVNSSPNPDWLDSYERLAWKMWRKVRSEYHSVTRHALPP